MANYSSERSTLAVVSSKEDIAFFSNMSEMPLVLYTQPKHRHADMQITPPYQWKLVLLLKAL